MALDVEERIRQINARLKAGKVGVSIQRRGDRLCLRGTLPPRPGSTKDKPFRQEIYLGVYSNPAGFTYAENEAKLVGSLLAKRKNIPIPQIARWVGNSTRIIVDCYAGVIEKHQVPSIL